MLLQIFVKLHNRFPAVNKCLLLPVRLLEFLQSLGQLLLIFFVLHSACITERVLFGIRQLVIIVVRFRALVRRLCLHLYRIMIVVLLLLLVVAYLCLLVSLVGVLVCLVMIFTVILHGLLLLILLVLRLVVLIVLLVLVVIRLLLLLIVVSGVVLVVRLLLLLVVVLAILFLRVLLVIVVHIVIMAILLLVLISLLRARVLSVRVFVEVAVVILLLILALFYLLFEFGLNVHSLSLRVARYALLLWRLRFVALPRFVDVDIFKRVRLILLSSFNERLAEELLDRLSLAHLIFFLFSARLLGGATN